ncbi:MAG: MFS transporter, partial [Tenericutes bacterium]|nr:MFS transporter [Mycoplasmatota bacterium]
KEPRKEKSENEEKISIKQMFSAIRKNDQMLWAALALLLYTVGSNLLVALGYNFFYMELGYDGSMITIFVATFGVSTILIQSFYSKIAKRFNRRSLMKLSIIILAFGYLMMLLLGYLPFLPINLITVCIFGGLVFSGQAIFYMITIVNMTNTIEYNEYKTGRRNEAVLFSLRPFVTKLASALQQGIVTLVLIVSGIFVLSQNVSQLEAQKSVFDNLEITEQVDYKANIVSRSVILDDIDIELESKEAVYDALELVTFGDGDSDGLEEMTINDAANTAFKDQATGSMRFIMRLTITILPILLIVGAFYIFHKKFIITEEYYDNMLVEINKRQLKEVE